MALLPPQIAPEEEAHPTTRASWLWLALAAVVTLAASWIIVTNAVPWLLGPAPFPPEWLWPWEQLSWTKVQTWAHLVGIALYLLLAILLLRPATLAAHPHRKLVWTLTLAMIGFLGLQLLLGWARKESLLDMVIFRTYAPPGNGYFMSAVRAESISDTLHNYQAAMPNFPHDRPQTHPPGIFVYYALWLALFDRLPDVNAWFAPIARSWALEGRDWVLLQDRYVSAAFFSGWTQLILGMFAPIAFYALLTRLDVRRARLSTFALAGALALPLLPSVNSFYTHWDVNYLLLTSAAWFFALRAQDGLFDSPGVGSWRRWLDWLWAGLILFLLTWFSFGNTVFLGIVGLHLLWRQFFVLPHFTASPAPLPPEEDASGAPDSATKREKSERRRFDHFGVFLVGGIITAAGVVLPWLLAYWYWGMNYVGLLRTGMERHYLIATAGRDFSIWVWMNLVDFALWIGVGLALLSVVATFWHLRHMRHGWREGNLAGMALLFWLVLLGLDLSGSARAEIGRLWLFLMPIPLMLVLGWQRDWRQRALILAMLALMTWTMGFAVRAV